MWDSLLLGPLSAGENWHCITWTCQVVVVQGHSWQPNRVITGHGSGPHTSWWQPQYCEAAVCLGGSWPCATFCGLLASRVGC